MDKSASNETALYKGFPSAEMWKPAYAYEIVTKPTFDESASRLFGALSFLNYSYNDIYLLDLSCRFDGSSEFGTDKKFAPFWSSGIGVNVHNYKYIKEHLPNLDIFKIRATYGQTGKVNFAPFEAQTMYTTYTKDWYSTGFGAIIQSLGNNRLKWEKTNTWDLGFDLKIYRGALDMRFSYYNKKTVDLVTDVAIPSSSGFSSYKDNLGEVRNEGVEVSLKTMILNRGDLLVSVYANIAHNKNEILKISESLAAYND
ncbi:MAG: TonB-dependent receptor domain-containing protein, partial [Butyricimonas faecihominis]